MNTGKQLQFEISIFSFAFIPFHYFSFLFYQCILVLMCPVFFFRFTYFFFVFLLIYCSKIQSRQADCHTHVQNVQCTCNQIFMFHPLCFCKLATFPQARETKEDGGVEFRRFDETFESNCSGKFCLASFWKEVTLQSLRKREESLTDWTQEFIPRFCVKFEPSIGYAKTFQEGYDVS